MRRREGEPGSTLPASAPFLQPETPCPSVRSSAPISPAPTPAGRRHAERGHPIDSHQHARPCHGDRGGVVELGCRVFRRPQPCRCANSCRGVNRGWYEKERQWCQGEMDAKGGVNKREQTMQSMRQGEPVEQRERSPRATMESPSRSKSCRYPSTAFPPMSSTCGSAASTPLCVGVHAGACRWTRASPCDRCAAAVHRPAVQTPPAAPHSTPADSESATAGTPLSTGDHSAQCESDVDCAKGHATRVALAHTRP